MKPRSWHVRFNVNTLMSRIDDRPCANTCEHPQICTQNHRTTHINIPTCTHKHAPLQIRGIFLIVMYLWQVHTSALTTTRDTHLCLSIDNLKHCVNDLSVKNMLSGVIRRGQSAYGATLSSECLPAQPNSSELSPHCPTVSHCSDPSMHRPLLQAKSPPLHGAATVTRRHVLFQSNKRFAVRFEEERSKRPIIRTFGSYPDPSFWYVLQLLHRVTYI